MRDAIVIGAGLSGLTAAVALAHAGCKVTVLERLDRAGGICGERRDAHGVFVRGSLEFGDGLFRRLRALGVEIRWHRSRFRLCLPSGHVTVPPRASELGWWARAGLGLAQTGRVLARAHGETLAQVLQRCRSSARVRELYAGLLLPGAMLFDDLTSDDARSQGGALLSDGLHRPGLVVGGPQALTDALVARLRQLGGALELGVACQTPHRDGAEVVVPTDRGERRASTVVSSQPRWGAWPDGARQGLALGQLLLRLNRPLALPDRLDALYHVPRDVDAWHQALDAGQWPADPGFSVVDPHLGASPERQTWLGYVPLPRGLRTLPQAEKDRVLQGLLARAATLVPGLDSAVAWSTLVLPDDYVALNGAEPTPALRLPRVGMARPPSYDARSGVHHLGSSVDPPGLHGAAVVRVAQAAAARAVAS